MAGTRGAGAGSRGPLPKPASLKVLAGNPGKRPLDLSGGVNPRIEVPSPPKLLSPAAKKEWLRITPHLYEVGLVTQLDLAALTMYCQAYGRLVDLETAFNGQVNRLRAEGLDYPQALLAASQTTTPSGYTQQSVVVQLLHSQRAEVTRLLGHFGLSPALRGRVQPSNYVDPQPTLPGIDEPPRPQGFAQFANPALH